MKLIEELRFILTEIGSNQNKFWNVSLYDNDDVVTEWGRVGYAGQSKTFNSAGRNFMQSKIREKEGKGYRPQQVLGGTKPSSVQVGSASELAQIAKTQIVSNNPLVEQLIARLARANVHHILQSTTMQYDASRGTFSTPLGIVDQLAIDQARDILVKIGSFVQSADYDNRKFMDEVNDYLMLVPQNIGMGRLNLRTKFPDMESVTKQNDILDSLEASLQAALSKPDDGSAPKPQAPKLFDLRLNLIEDSREIERIRKFYRMTNQKMHACSHLDVKTVYEVEIGEMHAEFEAKGRPVGNVMELWHGTKTANLLSIMKSGLKTSPPSTAAIAGKMFGNGIYFSDQSTKSLNYAYGYWHGSREDNCFMFLCNVAMGNYYVPAGPSSQLPMKGYDSTFAQAHKSGVMNNEMIVYRNEQVDLTRLVEFSPNGK
jgi:poly [ADP-ribose] polymerase 2/3/4